MIGNSTSSVEKLVEELEGKLEATREEMAHLKVQLYARFGKSINLET